MSPSIEQVQVISDPLRDQTNNDIAPYAVETFRLDAASAQAHLNLPHLPHERTRTPQTVNGLATEMVGGTFAAHQVMLAVGDLDGETLRLNGQHTAAALLQAAQYLPDISYMVRMARHRLRDLNHAAQIYSTYDRGRPRTSSHVVRIRTVHNAVSCNWQDSATRLLSQALPYWPTVASSSTTRMSPDLRVEIMVERYPDLCNAVAQFMPQLGNLRDREGTYWRRGATIGAMLQTFEVCWPGNLSVAEQFWRGVVRPLSFKGCSERDVRSLLAKKLKDLSGAGQHSAGSSREKNTWLCELAWNHFAQGSSPSVLKQPSGRHTLMHPSEAVIEQCRREVESMSEIEAGTEAASAA